MPPEKACESAEIRAIPWPECREFRVVGNISGGSQRASHAMPAHSMAESVPPAIVRNDPAERANAMAIFKAVFAATPIAIARAASSNEVEPDTPRAIDIVKASTSVKPRSAALVTMPVSPHVRVAR